MHALIVRSRASMDRVGASLHVYSTCPLIPVKLCVRRELTMPTILIIDDNSVERQTVQHSLQKAGYTALAAADGAAGIEMAKEHLPDLIICDVNMPGLSGFDTLKMLKEDAKTQGIPFVFLTGSVEAMAGKLGRHLGAEEYIEKPFSFSKLLAIVSSSLRQK